MRIARVCVWSVMCVCYFRCLFSVRFNRVKRKKNPNSNDWTVMVRRSFDVCNRSFNLNTIWFTLRLFIEIIIFDMDNRDSLFFFFSFLFLTIQFHLSLSRMRLKNQTESMIISFSCSHASFTTVNGSSIFFNRYRYSCLREEMFLLQTL